MSEKTPDYDVATLEAMNQKAVKNQLFTPDNVYLELGLLKDLPLGAVYMEHIVLKNDETQFQTMQETLLPLMRDYQTRRYDTVEPHLSAVGYDDHAVDTLLSKPAYHDYIFMMAPATKFIHRLILDTIRNQNHSKPAEKFSKKTVGKGLYVRDYHDVTYYINTYPLTLSEKIHDAFGAMFADSLGVNIVFLNKNPTLFDAGDWAQWMEKIDCFYFDNLGRFTRSPFVRQKQGDLQFAGCWFFARKRFERCVMRDIESRGDFDHQVQMLTALIGVMCDFEWLQNNDLRLTEEAEDVPMTDDQETPDPTPSTEP